MPTEPARRTNELLGYPPEARLLIINADDYGMYASINAGLLATLAQGVVTSTSLMTPCPGAAAAMRLLRGQPGIPFGVHLTIIRDLVGYRYGPLAPAHAVPSLVDDAGGFYHTDQRDELLARARLVEVETEFRAQIEAVLKAGLRPTHLDWHCLHNGGRADIFDLTLGLAREYGLAVRAAGSPLCSALQAQGLPAVDYGLLDSFRIASADKPARYLQLLRELPPGLSEWAVHPSLADAASQVIDDGWPVRHADYESMMSPTLAEVIRQEGIILLSYRPLQQAWQRTTQ